MLKKISGEGDGAAERTPAGSRDAVYLTRSALGIVHYFRRICGSHRPANTSEARREAPARNLI